MSNNTPFAKLNPFLPLPEISGKNPFATLGTSDRASASYAPNPFETRDPADVPADAPEGSYTYALVQSAPAVPAEECEVAAAAVEIAIRWGANTLHVAHLAPPRAFHVGEATGKDAVDFMLPAEKLGVARLPVVRKTADGAARVVVPAGAKGTATIAGQVVKLADLAACPQAEASAEVAGALELPLSASTKVRFELGGIEIEVASVNAGRKVSGRFTLDRRGLPFQVASMALHLGMLGAAAVLMPPFALASEDTMSRERIDDLKMILSTNAESERDMAKAGGEDAASGAQDDSRAEGPVKKSESIGSGKPGKWGPVGAGRNSQHSEMSKAETLDMARKFGMVGLLTTGMAGSPSSSAWSDAAANLGDPRVGAQWSSGLESGGDGVLALDGVGDSGGPGTGIDLGGVRTGGDPGGRGLFGKRRPGPGDGDGHRTGAPSIRQVDMNSSSQLPREIIQRVVRQSFGRFRLCYENGLRNNPSLAGRVSVRFVIGRDGGVMSAANGGSDLADPAVVSCVVAGFRGLQFPRIEDGGAATVTYPIVFAPAK